MGRALDSIVVDKSKRFAVRIVNLYKYLCDNKAEKVLCRQLLRSGTSIGANLHEAEEAFSRKDFAAKIYISLKEARETEYWLELLRATDYITESEYESINSDCSELLRLLVSITKTLRTQESE